MDYPTLPIGFQTGHPLEDPGRRQLINLPELDVFDIFLAKPYPQTSWPSSVSLRRLGWVVLGGLKPPESIWARSP